MQYFLREREELCLQREEVKERQVYIRYMVTSQRKMGSICFE